jgi:hypothetical protein
MVSWNSALLVLSMQNVYPTSSLEHAEMPYAHSIPSKKGSNARQFFKQGTGSNQYAGYTLWVQSNRAGRKLVQSAILRLVVAEDAGITGLGTFLQRRFKDGFALCEQPILYASGSPIEERLGNSYNDGHTTSAPWSLMRSIYFHDD